MQVREILRRKKEGVHTTSPDTTVREAMRTLVQHNIGALVVMENDTIRGIVTERDMLRAGADDPQRLDTDRVEKLMTRDVVTAEETVDLHEVMDIMTERRIRHLPIVKGTELRAMISIGDVVNALRKDSEAENRHLQAYIAGTPL
jgi:CBS domain-containing protein